MNPRLIKWLVGLAAIPMVLFAAVLVAGLSLPADHIVASAADFQAPPDSVWAVISDIGGGASWRPEVERVERGPDQNGNPVWIETAPTGSLPYEVTEMDPPHRMITRIADPELPFGGTWTYTVSPLATGARLTLVEHGEIRHPVFRVVARFIFGYHSTMDGYLTALGERFGEIVVPVHQEAPAS